MYRGRHLSPVLFYLQSCNFALRTIICFLYFILELLINVWSHYVWSHWGSFTICILAHIIVSQTVDESENL